MTTRQKQLIQNTRTAALNVGGLVASAECLNGDHARAIGALQRARVELEAAHQLFGSTQPKPNCPKCRGRGSYELPPTYPPRATEYTQAECDCCIHPTPNKEAQ
jgi:hypothetical protein